MKVKNGKAPSEDEIKSQLYKYVGEMFHVLYGCEIWALKQRTVRKLKTAEMKFMRCTAGYSLLNLRKMIF
jgi:hypothetical protein